MPSYTMIPSPPSLLRECYQFLVLKLQVMQWTCCRLSRGLDTTCGMQWIPWLHRSAWTSSHSITLPGIVHALQCTEGNCPPFDSTCSLPLVYTCYICTLCTVTHVQVCTCYVHVHVHVEVVWLHVRYMCEWFRRGFSCLLRCEGTQPSKGGPYRLYMFMYVYMSCISGFVGLQHLHLLHALVCVLPPAFYLTENMLSDLHLWYSIFRKATHQKSNTTERQSNKKNWNSNTLSTYFTEAAQLVRLNCAYKQSRPEIHFTCRLECQHVQICFICGRLSIGYMHADSCYRTMPGRRLIIIV